MMLRVVLGGAAAVILLLVLLGGRQEPSGAAASAATAPNGCPTALLSLGRNPVAQASRVALEGERKRDRPQVIGAVVATTDFFRSQQVVTRCGRRVASRSVVVSMRRRAFLSGPDQSASLSQSTVVVGRFKSGWRVWDVLH